MDLPKQLLERVARDMEKTEERAVRRKAASRLAMTERLKVVATQTPAWANREAIAAIYREAAVVQRRTGVPQHVDHVVPLRGTLVCGLHVEHNLRVITRVENCRKGNSHLMTD